MINGFGRFGCDAAVADGAERCDQCTLEGSRFTDATEPEATRSPFTQHSDCSRACHRAIDARSGKTMVFRTFLRKFIMATFSVNPHRRNPYQNFKFRVRWDGRYIAGVNKISGLKRTTEVVEYREGEDTSVIQKLPGRHNCAPIRLERGITHDAEFERWANKVWNVSAGAGGGLQTSLKNFRKDITIDLFNEAGQLVLSYRVYRCWVSEFQALPELDANGNAVAIEALTLQNEGWERDLEVTEPSEPAYDEPPAI